MDSGASEVKDRSHRRLLLSRYAFFYCVQVLHFEMNHFVSLSYFPFLFHLTFYCSADVLFLLFFSSSRLALSISLTLLPAPRCVPSPSVSSHSLNIIIVHVFFRFLINSVHISVKRIIIPYMFSFKCMRNQSAFWFLQQMWMHTFVTSAGNEDCCVIKKSVARYRIFWIIKKTKRKKLKLESNKKGTWRDKNESLLRW